VKNLSIELTVPPKSGELAIACLNAYPAPTAIEPIITISIRVGVYLTSSCIATSIKHATPLKVSIRSSSTIQIKDESPL
jgi:hypothetical protein